MRLTAQANLSPYTHSISTPTPLIPDPGPPVWGGSLTSILSYFPFLSSISSLSAPYAKQLICVNLRNLWIGFGFN